jgi:hypothetical protein
MVDVQGIETVVCDSYLELGLFRRTQNSAWAKMLKVPVRVNFCSRSSRIGYSQLPGSDGALSQGNSVVFVVVILVATRNFLYPGIMVDKTAFALPKARDDGTHDSCCIKNYEKAM